VKGQFVRATCRATLGFSLAFLAALILAACAPMAESATSAGAGESIRDPAVRKTAADRLVEHYLEMYSKHLKSRDWMARTMAVIGLARIDDPRITERLFEVLDKDKLPLVRVYVWEALHSRLGSLDETQRGRWVRTGKTLLGKGLLRGDLRVGLIRAVAPDGPTDENRRLFRHLFEKTNSMDSSDMRTLAAMRDVLAQWRDRTLIADLISVMANLDCVFRAEYVLGGLPWAVPTRANSAVSVHVERRGPVAGDSRHRRQGRGRLAGSRLRRTRDGPDEAEMVVEPLRPTHRGGGGRRPAAPRHHGRD